MRAAPEGVFFSKVYKVNEVSMACCVAHYFYKILVNPCLQNKHLNKTPSKRLKKNSLWDGPHHPVLVLKHSDVKMYTSLISLPPHIKSLKLLNDAVYWRVALRQRCSCPLGQQEGDGVGLPKRTPQECVSSFVASLTVYGRRPLSSESFMPTAICS